MSEQQVLHIDDQTFEKTIKEAGKPVLVDFYADWCGPCQMVAPIIEELSEKYQDQALVVKMNIDENRETPAKFEVMSIPTVMIFEWEDGAAAPKAKKIGFTGKDVYEKMIQDILGQ